MENIIICMKWGDKYSSEYVNRLYNMVKRNLTIPFRMVCITDDQKGITEKVKCFSMTYLNLPDDIPERGWNKLSVFKYDLYNLKGQALFLDLDVVITENIDCFFSYKKDDESGKFLVIHDWKRPWRITGNTSVFRFNIGDFPRVIPYFCENFDKIKAQFRNEQAFLCHFLKKKYNSLNYWPREWCKSYKYHCLKKIPWSFFQEPKLPDKAKIIIFHGEVNPPDAILGRGGKWYRYILPAPWIKNFWK